ncbi:MAG: hypothetical protein ACTSV2_14395 [Candidatus Thorarchaeota archaeon]
MTKKPDIHRIDSYIGGAYARDVYITGSLETDPEFIEFQNLLWQKKTQSKFTEDGRDSFVFQASHPRGFNLIIYPYWMVDEIRKGWEFIVYLKGWQREWDSWEERDRKHHAPSYMCAMEWAVSIADDWEIDPNHPEFPVTK